MLKTSWCFTKGLLPGVGKDLATIKLRATKLKYKKITWVISKPKQMEKISMPRSLPLDHSLN